MAATTLQQKKLQTLKRQLYGGDIRIQSSGFRVQTNHPKDTNVFSLDQVKITPTNISRDSLHIEENIYLKKDLLKILTLSSLVLGFQLLIFYAIQVNILPKWI